MEFFCWILLFQFCSLQISIQFPSKYWTTNFQIFSWIFLWLEEIYGQRMLSIDWCSVDGCCHNKIHLAQNVVAGGFLEFHSLCCTFLIWNICEIRLHFLYFCRLPPSSVKSNSHDFLKNFLNVTELVRYFPRHFLLITFPLRFQKMNIFTLN